MGSVWTYYLTTKNFFIMSLILTQTQNLRENSPGLYKYEDRASRVGMLDYFLRDTDAVGGILTSDLKERATQSIGHVLEAPVINWDSGVTISNTYSATISDDFNTSDMVQFDFVSFTWGWTETPSAHWNNEIKMQEDYNFSYLKYLHKFAKTLDTYCITAANTARSQVFANPLKYDTTGNMINADLADEMRVFADIEPIMGANDYYGGLALVGNGGFQSLINRIGGYGLYNAVNQKIQLQGRDLYYTNRITDAADKSATFYAINQGSVGLLYRFEREALLRTRSRTGHEWNLDMLVGLDIPVSTYYYEGVGDYSADHSTATSDNKRAHKRFFGFAVDVCFATAYNSDPTNIASPIIGVQIATT